MVVSAHTTIMSVYIWHRHGKVLITNGRFSDKILLGRARKHESIYAARIASWFHHFRVYRETSTLYDAGDAGHIDYARYIFIKWTLVRAVANGSLLN